MTFKWIVLFLISFALWAQSPDTSTVEGRVLDSTGRSVPGVAVTITNNDTGYKRDAITDDGGIYHFAGLSLTGAYKLSFSKSGFAPDEPGALQLRGGETATVNVTLKPAGLRDSITVYGTAAGLRADAPGNETTFGPQKISDTPVVGRKLTTLPLLNAAVRPARGQGDLFLNSTLFVVNGSGRRQTPFLIDGSSGNDDWGRQSIFTTLPFSSVQEFTVAPTAYSAEFGRSTGSVVNIVTRAGTNDVHGDILYLIRPGALEASSPGAPRRVEDRLQQVSGSISGPIVQNKTQFLISSEYSNEHRDSAITSPLAPGIFTGNFQQALLLARVDHQINDRNSLFARVNFDRLFDTNPSDAVGGTALPSVARTFYRRTYEAQIGENMVVSPSAINQLRLQFQLGSPITRFTTANQTPQLVRTGISTEGESRVANLLNHSYQINDTFVYTRGRQSIKIGGDAIFSSTGGQGTEFGTGYTSGQFTFRTGIPITTPTSALTINDVARFTQSFGNANYNVQQWLWSVFAQDNIKVGNNLTLNLGVRYERQTFSDDNNNFAPRVGFAYNFGGDAHTVMRGGYGMFYSQLRANLGAQFEQNGPQGVFTFTVTPGQFGFPTSIAALPAFPASAVLPARDIVIRPGNAAYYSQFFDVSKLKGYPNKLLNPYTQQANFGVDRELGSKWFVSVDYVFQHTIKIDRLLDLNSPAPFVRTRAGQTRTAAVADLTRPIIPVNNGYRRIQAVINNGDSSYNAFQANVNRRFGNKFSLLMSYTLSHTINDMETDNNFDPNDANYFGQAEKTSSLLDQRHRGAISGWYDLPGGVSIGTFTTLASGRPYNFTTGVDNNGDSTTSDRPVINGTVIGRNAGQGTPVYDFGFSAQKLFRFGERASASVRAEASNLLNHANITGRQGLYGNLATGLPDPSANPAFGQPLSGIANVDPGRAVQFLVRFQF